MDLETVPSPRPFLTNKKRENSESCVMSTMPIIDTLPEHVLPLHASSLNHVCNRIFVLLFPFLNNTVDSIKTFVCSVFNIFAYTFQNFGQIVVGFAR